jgi:hypothetical protein
LVNGDTATNLTTAPTLASATLATANAGTYTGTITASGAVDGNYTISYLPGTLTIGKAALTIAAVTDSKTYDGTTASSATPVVGTLFGSDTVTGLTEVFGSKDVLGSNASTLSVTGYTINDGNGGNNYTVTLAAASGTIVPATLTAVLTGSTSKTYDGDTSATLDSANYTLSGTVFAGDTVDLNDPATGFYDNKNAGTAKAVSVSGLTLDNANYVLSSTTASANIGTIGAATLTASLAGTVTKTYDGTAAATLTASNYDLSGVVGSDSVLLNSPSAGVYDTKDVGTGKIVTVSGVALTGADANNYVLASTTLAAANGVVNTAPLSITADNISAFALDLAEPTASATGFVGGDSNSVITGLQFGLFPVTGDSLQYDIVPFGASAPDYAITYFAGLLTLNPPPPTGASAPLVTDGGFTSVSSFTVAGNFGSQSFSDVATSSTGGSSNIEVFSVGLPGSIVSLGSITVTDYSNSTADTDRLVKSL